MPKLKKSVECKTEPSFQEETKTESVEEKKEIIIPKSKKESCMTKLKPFISEETKTVRGRFRNFETPGASATIMVQKYPGVPMFNKSMIDNEVYEIPLYVARFLNGVDITAKAANEKIHTCSYAVHGFSWDHGQPMPGAREDERGIPVPIVGVAKRVRRYGFESLEFDKAI